MNILHLGEDLVLDDSAGGPHHACHTNQINKRKKRNENLQPEE